MERFTAAIRQSLETQNWYSALYLSLTLPDICARLESDDGKTSPALFIKWFDRYLADRYRHRIGGNPIPHVFLSGQDCYALRCAMLHEGWADISTQRRREALNKFHFSAKCSHCNQFGTTLQLDVSRFCNDICEAVQNWHSDFKKNHADKMRRIADLVTVHVGTHHMGNGISFSGSE